MIGRTIHRLLVGVVLFFPFCAQVARAEAPALQSLAREFFTWRAVTQPATGDDVNRVERPEGWVPDWSPKALTSYNARQKEFSRRLTSLSKEGWTISDSVDYLVLRAAIARVDHELNVVRSARKNPNFYIQQTLGAVYELLLPPPPFPYERSKELLLRLESIPATLEHARTNLTGAVRPFAQTAIDNLAQIQKQMDKFSLELVQLLPLGHQKRFISAVIKSTKALVSYRKWLEDSLSHMNGSFAIGAVAYDAYLKEIALMPFTGDDVLRMGRIEWERSVAFDHYESLRNASIPPPHLFPDADEQIRIEAIQEDALRRFLIEKDILDVPGWVQHYRNMKTPPYLEPLTWLGVVDDLTSPSRLDENSVSYIPEPSPNLSFFRKASAQDPRPLIVHEGVPGHYLQLVLSWEQPNFMRRHYVDSGPIEGIGFYAEEMMLQHGLFEDAPRTREIIYRFMRLRALRVDVDVKLARGEYTIEDAGRYLAQTVPMDEATAQEEAIAFAANPGQAITYQIGKTQIIKLIADAKIQMKEKFDLRELHNYLWRNGNVPIALLRWEYLGRRDELGNLWPD